jgi:hypothetical protein
MLSLLRQRTSQLTHEIPQFIQPAYAKPVDIVAYYKKQVKNQVEQDLYNVANENHNKINHGDYIESNFLLKYGQEDKYRNKLLKDRMQQLGLTSYDFKPSETSLTIGNDDEDVNKLDMLINDFVLKVKSGLFDISMLSELNEIFKIIQLKSYLFSNELLDKYITYFEDMNVILGDKQTETVATEKGLSGEAILKALKNILVRCISILKLLFNTSGKTVDDKKLIVIEYVKSDKFKIIETRIIEDISKKIKQSQEDLEKARTKKQKTLAKTIEKQLRTIERGLRVDMMETPTRFEGTPMPDFDIFEDIKDYKKSREVEPTIVQPVPTRKPSPIDVGPSPVITAEAKDDEGRPFVEDAETARQVAELQKNLDQLDEGVFRQSTEIIRLNQQKETIRANEKIPQEAKDNYMRKANADISKLQGDINAYRARMDEIKARIAVLQTGRIQGVVEEMANVINADGRGPDVEPVDEEDEEEDEEEEEEEEEDEDEAAAEAEEPKPKSKSSEFFIYPPGITCVGEYVTVYAVKTGKITRDVILPRTLEKMITKKKLKLDNVKKDKTIQMKIQKSNEDYSMQLLENFNAIVILLDRYGQSDAKMRRDLDEFDADYTGDKKLIEKITYLYNTYLIKSTTIIVPSNKKSLFN